MKSFRNYMDYHFGEGESRPLVSLDSLKLRLLPFAEAVSGRIEYSSVTTEENARRFGNKLVPPFGAIYDALIAAGILADNSAELSPNDIERLDKTYRVVTLKYQLGPFEIVCLATTPCETAVLSFTFSRGTAMAFNFYPLTEENVRQPKPKLHAFSVPRWMRPFFPTYFVEDYGIYTPTKYKLELDPSLSDWLAYCNLRALGEEYINAPKIRQQILNIGEQLVTLRVDAHNHDFGRWEIHFAPDPNRADLFPRVHELVKESIERMTQLGIIQRP